MSDRIVDVRLNINDFVHQIGNGKWWVGYIDIYNGFVTPGRDGKTYKGHCPDERGYFFDTRREACIRARLIYF